MRFHIYINKISLWFTESKYKNLCAACDNPSSCYITDQYYGEEGVLFCLTDNVGDVAWVRLDIARAHFKVKISLSFIFNSIDLDRNKKKKKFV